MCGTWRRRLGWGRIRGFGLDSENVSTGGEVEAAVRVCAWVVHQVRGLETGMRERRRCSEGAPGSGFRQPIHRRQWHLQMGTAVPTVKN